MYCSNINPLANDIKEFQQALSEEIQALKNNGGRKVFLSGGRYLTEQNHEYSYVYTFNYDVELLLPDDTEAEIKHKEKTYECIIISSDSFEVIIGLKTKINLKTVEEVILNTEPWFLLEELKKRLDGMNTSYLDQYSLLYNLLFYTGNTSNSDLSDTRNKLELLALRSNKTLMLNERQELAVDKCKSQQS